MSPSSSPRPASRLDLLILELKRRQVFRVAAVYGGTTFVLVQAADLLLPRLGLPDWTVTLVVALALLGFPLALVFAWIFERGPEGLRKTEAAPRAELQTMLAQPLSGAWRAGLAGLAGVLLLTAAALWTLGVGPRLGAASYTSIAVLPFANLSDSPEDEYFGDGLAEELLNALSGIPGLRVAARTSAFAFKNTSVDVRTIGDTLNVATVLEGSVRRARERVRISVQLVDAGSGYQLWSETYDRPLTDLFAVQDAIAREIVEALSLRLAAGTNEQLYRGGTASVEAYDLYLLGRQKWALRLVQPLRESVAHFEAAVARDSGFALAWSGLADAIDAFAWRSVDGRGLVPKAKAAAQRALVLDPKLAEAWASLGVLYLDFDFDTRFAELALRRAIELKPSYVPAYYWLADLMVRSGRVEESLQYSGRAVDLDPMAGLALQIHAHSLLNLHRWADARAVFERMRALNWLEPSMALAQTTNARAMGYDVAQAEQWVRDWARVAGSSRPEEAVVVARALYTPSLRASAVAKLREMRSAGIPERDLAELAAAVGDYDYALELLEGSLQESDPRLVRVGISPAFDPIRSRPRFLAVARAARFTPSR